MIEGQVNSKEYVLETAKLLNLSIETEYLPKVAENWLEITKIASLVTEFELSEDIESAASFQPEKVKGKRLKA